MIDTAVEQFGSRAGAAYTAAKHGIVGLTKNVGFQYAKSGIRCNAIAPGAVATNIGTSINAPDPFGMGAFLNGTVVTADGGWTAY